MAIVEERRLHSGQVPRRSVKGETVTAVESRTQPLNVLVIDDRVIVRSGVRNVLLARPEVASVGEACSLKAATSYARRRYDVALASIALLHQHSAMEMARLRQRMPNVALIALMPTDVNAASTAPLWSVVTGYLTEDSSADELLVALRRVVEGRTYVSPSLVDILLSRTLNHQPSIQKLSAQEENIAQLIASGLRLKDIATRLSIAVSTVNTYKRRIKRKLCLRTNADIIRYALGQAAEHVPMIALGHAITA